MLLDKITLNNLGVFLGRHVIDLRPRVYKEKVRPIILFGGMNGSGKTTIFDAIKLCLYGPDIFEKSNASVYKKYLKEKINSSNGALIKPDFASVELEFEYSTFGEKNTYSVERSWEKAGKEVNEFLRIKKDGEPVDEVAQSNWQGFIKELLPLGLSQLFFFDGEKIQKIMHDEDNSELKKSIMTLLGLDLIERLQSDLKIYKRGLLKKEGSSALNKQVASLEKQLEDLEKEFNRATSDLKSDHQRKIDDINADIKECENRIEAQGGGYFARKDVWLEKQKQIENKLDSVSEDIRRLAAGLLPVSISMGVAQSLLQQLEHEQQIQSVRSSEQTLAASLKLFSKNIGKKAFLGSLQGVEITNKEAFRKSLNDAVKSALKKEEGPSQHGEIHQLSSRQAMQLLDDITYATDELPKEMRRLTKEHEKTYRELQSLNADREKVPDEDLMKPLYEKLSSLSKELGKLEAEKRQKEEKIASLDFKKDEVSRARERLLRKQEANTRMHGNIELINRSHSVLSAYHKKLSHTKIKKLQKEVTDIFLALHRKEDLISRIEINPETLDIYIYDKYGSKVNKNRLSSGELEVYAISMVWALARISGQSLPFAVDTPLARLDSKHRNNLVTKFFPNASHQILIFSTDTEVDRKYFGKLKDHIARAYHFDYLDYEKRSEIKTGYFWE